MSDHTLNQAARHENSISMLIPANILMRYGALQKVFEKGEYIYHDGDQAKYYFQIAKGKVKVYNSNDEGKVFLQGIFTDGESFGEPPMMINERYPSSAVAITRSVVHKLNNEAFWRLLNDLSDYKQRMLMLMASRCYAKSIVTREVINQRTEHRLLAFLGDFRRKRGNPQERLLVPFTRQEIADFTGLRVETVIRTLKLMEAAGQVEIRERKLYS